MITKITDDAGHSHAAIVLTNRNGLDDVVGIQNALIWAIKCIADNKGHCGVSIELWELADLLSHTLLSEPQLDQLKCKLL